MQNQFNGDGGHHPDIGVRAIQRDYEALIGHLKANDVGAAHATIAALKHNIESMKALSGFAKEASLAVQSAIVYVIKGLVDLMTETESSIRSVAAQHRDVQANQETIRQALVDKERALGAIRAKIEQARRDLAEQERKKAAKRSSNIPIWKWLKRAFYAALDVINAAIEKLQNLLHLARDDENALEREMAHLAQDAARLKTVLANIEAKRRALQAELDQLGKTKKSLVDIKQYMEVQLVFFNNVANFYAQAAGRCDSVQYDIADFSETMLLLADDNPAIDYFVDTQIERLSLMDAVTRFDQMVYSAYQALEGSPA
ncbi:hypothetical protein [Achromobacter sp. Bel]|uniref:hypothetical protein n=1 Tax=Achromobacter sp. Bel TaxID=2727415 RepID=UPI00145CB8B8|nr:hypothetical protein [Achromobacter sp. Bel]NMK44746.1 hypothetical protein [Achromobacter sp. Bel]